MRAFVAATATCVLLALAVAGSAAPLGEPGAVAVYQLNSDPAERPEFERENRLTVVSAEVWLGPAVEEEDRAFQWYGLSWTRLSGQRYDLWVLIDGWPTAEEDPDVRRYLWREPEWPDPVSFVHEVTGEVLLPPISLWSYGWPQNPEMSGASRAPAAGTPETIVLQGWPFTRVSLGSVDIKPPAEWTTVRLNPDLLIGWISQDRDVEGRPSYRLPDGAYKYQHKTPEDLIAHAEAGCNFFVSHPGMDQMPEWLTRSNCFHNNLGFDSQDWPADLYRPNYWGFGNHVDEPGVHNWGLAYNDDPGEPSPLVQAVESLQRIMREGVEKRGRTKINDKIAGNFGLGDLRIVEEPSTIVTWEYEWPTAWYQFAVEDGVGGIVDEDAALGDLVESYNRAFGTVIPPTVENACAIRVAVLRGAARNFGKYWGVAFYHPSEAKLKSASIPYLYNKGASRFWFWTGWVGITDNSGLPYAYQRYYASLARQAFAANGNRDMGNLLRAAKTAVVIPYGYTFAPHSLHRIPWLHLERQNEHGVSFRQVLVNAAMEVERLLRLGIEFDVAVDDPLFLNSGYDELIYAQAGGKVRVVRPGHSDEVLDAPRAVERPDLGPDPKLSIEIVESADAEPDKVVLRAVPEIGAGEWAGETGEPWVQWEVYGPDGMVRPATFPEFGLERTLDVDPGETWTVRAAVADVFGRAAVAYRTVTSEQAKP